MALTEKGYKKRLVDDTIERYNRLFGALSIEGPKWCGKTWTALNHANSAVFILNPENNYAIREAALLNPVSILEGTPPLLVDEWQEVPAIWDAVRFLCDRTKTKGGYLLTGSVTPKEKQYSHSGTGRIARIQMRTMSLFESGESNGCVSLKALFDGKTISPDVSKLNQDSLIIKLVRGGWPESINIRDKDAGIIAEQYVQSLVEIDVSNADDVKRDPVIVKQVLAAFARVNGTAASNNRIVADVQERYGYITRQTVSEYLSTLKRLYIIDEIPQWFPELRDRMRLRKTPKRILTDPSIAVAALQATPAELVRDPRTLGILFENMCMRDLLIYADVIGAKLTHYHDDTGLEVDAIVSMGNRWGAIEIKLGTHRVDEAVAALKRLSKKIEAKGGVSPSFLAVITNGGPVFTRDDGIHVIPIDCLSP